MAMFSTSRAGRKPDEANDLRVMCNDGIES